MSQTTDGPGGPECRHQPKQSRSVETWNSILEAAADLLAEQGYEQTTTHQIARQAGVSVGALYRYFADKQDILRELYRRDIAGLRTRVFQEFNITDLFSQDVSHLVRKTLALAFKVYAERLGLRRVLGEQSRKIPELAELRASQEEVILEAVRQILSGVRGVSLPDVEVGAYLTVLFIESLIDDFILYRRDQPRFDEDRIIDAATDFIVRYALGKVE